MAGPRNGAAFFSDMIPVDLSGGDVQTPGCIGVYITTGGILKFVPYGSPATRTVTFPDNFYVPGMIQTIISAGTTAAGIHYCV
jgi:hypothetical protein